jgi:hypothetical protein
MSEPIDWLDTQTKEQLEPCPPQKLAPPVVAGYSLILLEQGPDPQRMDRTLRLLARDTIKSPYPCPGVIQSMLSLTDALLGQFELICADSISVFLDDEVWQNAKKSYLNDLFQTLRQSTEFQPVRVSIPSLPDGERVAPFLEQFFGEARTPPITQVVARKKSRIMRHWGSKLDISVECEDVAR